MNGRSSFKLSLKHRSENGQSVVEVALMLPILALLLIGLLEFGLILYAHVQVANAAREAARAASLYRVTRYGTDTTPLGKCDGNIEGWSLNQTVQQAIVYRQPDGSGCPGTASSTLKYTSLGWLDPKPTPMWTVTLQDTDSGFIPQPNGTELPIAGKRMSVQLRYPYQLMIISNLLPFLSDPVWVSKSVEFEFQQ